MPSSVYLIDLRSNAKENLPDKLARLLDTAGIGTRIRSRDLVAVKLHFGERGNTAFIRPVYLRTIVETVKKHQAVPFLTDANTLYAGSRGDSVRHHRTAIENGFAFSVVKAPIVIADGLRGRSETAVRIDGAHFEEVFIGAEIDQADALVSVAHFKGHELTGFGGTLKNLGMGCASRRGKMAQHANLGPKITRKKCVGCGDCVLHCSQQALSLVEKKARIDLEKCIGCAECILICRNEAIRIRWNQSIPIFMEKMMEYTQGVLQNKAGRTFFVNFITDVSPACDCAHFNDAPIVQDIGIVASLDPVAIDQASVDLVNQAPVPPGCCLGDGHAPGDDKFKTVYPKVEWELQLDHAEKLGLGSRRYELIKI